MGSDNYGGIAETCVVHAERAKVKQSIRTGPSHAGTLHSFIWPYPHDIACSVILNLPTMAVMILNK